VGGHHSRGRMEQFLRGTLVTTSHSSSGSADMQLLVWLFPESSLVILVFHTLFEKLFVFKTRVFSFQDLFDFLDFLFETKKNDEKKREKYEVNYFRGLRIGFVRLKRYTDL
jgi:hypothetical protein